MQRIVLEQFHLLLIQAKYEQLLYMCKDEDSSEDSNELNSQLFAAARTNELLTSLRYVHYLDYRFDLYWPLDFWPKEPVQTGKIPKKIMTAHFT